jgi:hypothetical protein
MHKPSRARPAASARYRFSAASADRSGPEDRPAAAVHVIGLRGVAHFPHLPRAPLPLDQPPGQTAALAVGGLEAAVGVERRVSGGAVASARGRHFSRLS